ncbi:DUF2628 domain-containing protein, partial [Leptotrichia massiliensis]
MKQINGKRAVLENGVLRKEVKFGFSKAAFFLGFIYPLIKGDYMIAGIAFIIIGTAGLIFFPLTFVLLALFGLKYNEMHVKKLIKQGWYPFTQEDAQVLKMNGILFNDTDNFFRNNGERIMKEAENLETQQLGKTETIEFKETKNNGDFRDMNNNSIDNVNTNTSYNNPEINYKNRTIQKFVARSIGGGLV